jgi:hypothetical protein
VEVQGLLSDAKALDEDARVRIVRKSVMQSGDDERGERDLMKLAGQLVMLSSVRNGEDLRAASLPQLFPDSRPIRRYSGRR